MKLDKDNLSLIFKTKKEGRKMLGGTGFDPAVVRSAIEKEKAAYRDLIYAVVDCTKTNFVDKMATCWACKEAQTWFLAFKGVIDGLSTEITNTFQSVVDGMNEAGRIWAQNTGGTEYTDTTFFPNEQKLDVDGIKENIDGVRGIIEIEAKENVKQLQSTVLQKVQDALTAAKEGVFESGFMDAETKQGTNLIASLTEIKTNIESAMSTIVSEAMKAIEDTANRYGNQAVSIANAFSGGEQ